MAEVPDQADRDAARWRLDANVVVEAGAGTGKTTLLTDRILFLLLGDRRPQPARVDRVVALTFTEKAAGEIKERLAERLSEIAARLAGAPLAPEAERRAQRTVDELSERFGRGADEVLARARAAVEDLDKAPIGTIHSFCAQLLRLHPIEAGLDPAFRVDDGDALEEIFEAEWSRFLEDELGERPSRPALWRRLLSAAKLEDLRALAFGLAQEPHELDGLADADAASARELEALAVRVRSLAAGRGKPRGRILEAIEQIAGRLGAAAEAARTSEPRAAAPTPEPLLRAAWPKSWIEDESGRADYERAVRLAERASPHAEAAVREAARLLAPLARAVRREHARRGWVSFDGLLRRARDLARDHPRVRERLRARYAAILIDEFQDTDPLQGELLMFLSERPGPPARRWEDVVPEPGRIFVVGDPKQSIYRFRGADIAAYEGFVRRLRETGAILCALTANFRSVPEIVAPVNAAMESAMRAEPGVQPAYKAILPARAPRGEGAAVRVVAAVAPEDADAARAVEAAWVAARIAREGRVPGRACAGRRPLKDFAVLLRSSRALPAYLEAFRRAGLPAAVDIERFFYDSPEVTDALNLLAALDDPSDRTALAGLLRSPLACVSDDGLLALARAGGLDARRAVGGGLDENERARVAELFATLRELGAGVGRRPLGELAAEAFRRTNLVETCARAYHGQQTAANLDKLLRMAADASDGRGATLKEFCARLRRASRRSLQEGANTLVDERLEAVRVMSVHKSKGLEFPVVFVASLSSRPSASGAEARVRRGAGDRPALELGANRSAASALALERERDLERAELVRLLYVAMTRAKEELWLMGAERPESGSAAARLLEAGCWPQDGRDGRFPVERVPAAPELLAAAAPAPAPADGDAAVRRWRRSERWREAAEAAPFRAAAADEGAAAPSGPRAPGGEHGARVGRLCHRVLQDWDYRRAGDLSAAVSRALLALARLDAGADWEAARSIAEPMLKKFLSSGLAEELARVDILGREVPFFHAEGETVVRGAIDLIYRDPADGALVVGDYKSEPVDERSRERALESHAAQGRAYAQAVEKAWGKTARFRVLFLRRPDLSSSGF